MFHVWLNSIQQTAIKKVSDRPLRREGELHVTLHENSFILAGGGGDSTACFKPYCAATFVPGHTLM